MVNINPGSHGRRKHKDKINTKTNKISPLELAKIKHQEFFFVSSFVRFLAYAWTMILCLCLRRSLCHRLDFVLPIVLFLYTSLCSRVDQALELSGRLHIVLELLDLCSQGEYTEFASETSREHFSKME